MHASGRLSAATLATLFASSSAGLAQVPHPWQMGMQAPASPVMEQVRTLNNAVLVVIVLITVFVGGLLVYVLWRYNAKRNPVPGTVSHNTTLEIAWTAIPILILVGMSIPSFRLVFYQDHVEKADMTIKVVGHQWYWEYQYPDQAGMHFDSYMLDDEALAKDPVKYKGLRRLAVDNQLVVPAGKVIRVITTSSDVIHSFFIPSLGVQRYAIPGHAIETWFKVNQPGDYYGECNQICGTNHSAMPISVHAVSADDFAAWVAQSKTKLGMNGQANRLALNTEH